MNLIIPNIYASHNGRYWASQIVLQNIVDIF